MEIEKIIDSCEKLKCYRKVEDFKEISDNIEGILKLFNYTIENNNDVAMFYLNSYITNLLLCSKKFIYEQNKKKLI